MRGFGWATAVAVLCLVAMAAPPVRTAGEPKEARAPASGVAGARRPQMVERTGATRVQADDKDWEWMLRALGVLVAAVSVVTLVLRHKAQSKQEQLSVTPILTACTYHSKPGRHVEQWIELTNGGKGAAQNVVCRWGLASRPGAAVPAPTVEDRINQLLSGSARRLRETTGDSLFLESAEITYEDAEGHRHWSQYNKGGSRKWVSGKGDPPKWQD